MFSLFSSSINFLTHFFRRAFVRSNFKKGIDIYYFTRYNSDIIKLQKFLLEVVNMVIIYLVSDALLTAGYNLSLNPKL